MILAHADRKRNSAFHQSGSVVCAFGGEPGIPRIRHFIVCLFIKSLKMNVVFGHISVYRLHDGRNDNHCPVGRYIFPCAHLIAKRIRKAVIIAVLNDWCQAAIPADLFADGFFFFRRKPGGIKFIAEGSRHGGDGSGFERGHAAVLLIGRYGYVCPHCTDRITEGGSILDSQTVNRVRIIAAPDLRGIEQHAGIETSAAAGTPFHQQLRIALPQHLQQAVNPENIIIKYLSLVLCRRRIDICNVPVAVPLHIFNVCVIQHLAHSGENIVNNLRA